MVPERDKAANTRLSKEDNNETSLAIHNVSKEPKKPGMTIATLLRSFDFHPAPHNANIWTRTTQRHHEYVAIYHDDIVFAYEDESKIPFGNQLHLWHRIAEIQRDNAGSIHLKFLPNCGNISADLAAHWHKQMYHVDEDDGNP